MAVTPSLLAKEVPAYVMWEMYIPFGSLIQNKPIIMEVHTIKKFCCFTKLQREPLKLPRPHLKNGRIKTSQIGVICILKLSFKMKMTTCTSKREGTGKKAVSLFLNQGDTCLKYPHFVRFWKTISNCTKSCGSRADLQQKLKIAWNGLLPRDLLYLQVPRISSKFFLNCRLELLWIPVKTPGRTNYSENKPCRLLNRFEQPFQSLYFDALMPATTLCWFDA